MRCKKTIERYHPDKKRSFFECCPKMARVFYKVRYADGIKEDVFGFCPDCAVGMDDIHNWKRGWSVKDAVFRLHKPVTVIMRSTEEEMKGKQVDSFRDSIKDQFKAIMAYKRNRKVPDDEWKAIFEEAFHDLVVERVMGS